MKAVHEESAVYCWLLEDTTTISTDLQDLIPLVLAVGLFSQTPYISFFDFGITAAA